MKCIILPSTFYNCDDLVDCFNENFIVYCRDLASLNYCKKINNRANFIFHDDMAISSDISDLDNSSPCYSNNPLIERSKNIMLDFLNNNSETGFFIREDCERKSLLIPECKNNIDISGLLFLKWYEMTYENTKNATLLLLWFLSHFNTIYTNRLHIAIAADILNKKIMLYDNSYGKIFNVYSSSLNDHKNITFIK